jgi:hypothetical protein
LLTALVELSYEQPARSLNEAVLLPQDDLDV